MYFAYFDNVSICWDKRVAKTNETDKFTHKASVCDDWKGQKWKIGFFLSMQLNKNLFSVWRYGFLQNPCPLTCLFIAIFVTNCSRNQQQLSQRKTKVQSQPGNQPQNQRKRRWRRWTETWWDRTEMPRIKRRTGQVIIRSMCFQAIPKIVCYTLTLFSLVG